MFDCRCVNPAHVTRESCSKQCVHIYLSLCKFFKIGLRLNYTAILPILFKERILVAASAGSFSYPLKRSPERRIHLRSGYARQQNPSPPLFPVPQNTCTEHGCISFAYGFKNAMRGIFHQYKARYFHPVHHKPVYGTHLCRC